MVEARGGSVEVARLERGGKSGSVSSGDPRRRATVLRREVSSCSTGGGDGSGWDGRGMEVMTHIVSRAVLRNWRVTEAGDEVHFKVMSSSIIDGSWTEE